MNVKAFIFDIGNVLVRLQLPRLEAALARFGFRPDSRAAMEELAVRYEHGFVSREDFLAAMRAFVAPGVSETELAAAWNGIFDPHPLMWEVVEKLHPLYPLYLLSNTNGLHHAHLLEEYAVFARFADGVFSYREGLAKPDARIFARALEKFGLDAGTTVYLDDLPANVAAANAAGLRGVLYHPDAHDDCLRALHALGVQCV